MKLLFENWRKYLSEGRAKYAGLFMLMPDDDVINKIRLISADLPPLAKPLKEEDLHVTLLGHRALEPHRESLKAIREAGGIPPGPPIALAPGVEERSDDVTGKRSWVVWVENQQDMRDYVNQVMGMVGGPTDPEPDRKFHISIANLTGYPHDSVK
tara:strand:- start:804 stop:1268 length:465 start_codon:yes stop_codon:yes gene_type:complete